MPSMFESLMKTNPRFAAFVNKNKDKTPEQVAKEYGIDINIVKQLLNGARGQ